MPIDYKEYAPDWKEIRAVILKRAEDACELCAAENHQDHWKTGSKVVLTVHHINGEKEDNRDANLLALCQRCHLRLHAPRGERKEPPNLKAIVKQWLKNNGYSGLTTEDATGPFGGDPACGCGLDDFMPCDEPTMECKPAYQGKCQACGETWYCESREGIDECERCPLPVEDTT